jgi:hypothetical protein
MAGQEGSLNTIKLVWDETVLEYVLVDRGAEALS